MSEMIQVEDKVFVSARACALAELYVEMLGDTRFEVEDLSMVRHQFRKLEDASIPSTAFWLTIEYITRRKRMDEKMGSILREKLGLQRLPMPEKKER